MDGVLDDDVLHDVLRHGGRRYSANAWESGYGDGYEDGLAAGGEDVGDMGDMGGAEDMGDMGDMGGDGGGLFDGLFGGDGGGFDFDF